MVYDKESLEFENIQEQPKNTASLKSYNKINKIIELKLINN